MTVKEQYAQDVKNKSCVACGLYDDEIGACCIFGTCGAEHKKFQPIGLAGYEMKSEKSAAKYDTGKLEIDLVPPQIVRDIAEVRMYGTKKYKDPDNWKKVELRRYVNALLRHTLAFMADNRGKDEESGLPHYKHMACNLAFICQLLAEDKHGE